MLHFSKKGESMNKVRIVVILLSLSVVSYTMDNKEIVKKIEEHDRKIQELSEQALAIWGGKFNPRTVTLLDQGLKRKIAYHTEEREVLLAKLSKL
jgi:hypothetical protein